MIELSRIEAVLDEPVLAAQISALEARLPLGIRPRQCSLRTLLVGMLEALCKGRQVAHLVGVHDALVGLDAPDKVRLGVTATWRSGPHELTYRQVEYTARLLVRALGKDAPDGGPSRALQAFADALVETSVPEAYKVASSSYAIDWTDVESFSRPPAHTDGPCADPEAAFGHRRGDGPGQRDELFFGYYASAMTMVNDEGGDVVPELIRRMQLISCRLDPVPSFVTVVTASAANGVVLSEVLADSGYSYKVAEHFALPLRSAGVSLAMDLHPNDRGTKGTYAGAILWNGNCYCPATPPALFELGPLSRGASEAETALHDEKAAEIARYKLGRLTRDDRDGYHRVCCPAAAGKCRCPLRPESMALASARPEIFSPPEQPPHCCTQHTVTVPPEVNAKTAQRHDYTSAAWRRSYARRSAGERANSRLKDPAGINIDQKGWCKLMGLTPLGLFLACACVVVNFGLVDAFEARRGRVMRDDADENRPRQRRRRRRTLAELARATANAPP
ncbi:MAG: hypothetical protein M0010_05240 [Actinomycetota bacterium]|nr:hypothetical protein [Actinomycetota bacterium]